MINALINAAVDRARTTMMILVFLFISGLVAFNSIPKESQPDVAIPIIYVSMTYDGISPEDGERLLVRPMEKELKSIEGIKEMRAVSGEGHASVTLEFDAGFDADKALLDVREKVDAAKSKLPADTDEPQIHEVNVALFPVLSLALSGDVPERVVRRIARDLKDNIEGLSGVLEVDIGGDREELMEVIVDPQALESYNIDYYELLRTIDFNNRLVAAGAIDTDNGRQVLKVPGVIDNVEDMLNMPVKVVGDQVVTFQDIASVRSTFKDPEGFARVGGKPAMVLEVKKKVGANIIQTIEEVQALVNEHQKLWPQGLKHSYIMDQSTQVKTMLDDLLNNVMTGIVLVMIIILGAMGLRSSLLVGLAIPGSFLAGILVLNMIGYTLNIVVLFSLILVVGMLVDGAIVVIELADRRMKQGIAPKESFAYAARRMAWPVIAATLTTLVVFMPLVFWPGVVGQFMKYLPITVLFCLTASLLMALVFMPVLGGVISRSKGVQSVADEDELPDTEFNKRYRSILATLLRHPGKTLGAALLLIAGTYLAYFQLGHGVEFFPETEPESALVDIHARGDLSIAEKDALLFQVERRLLDFKELKSVYGRSFSKVDGEKTEDVIATIQFQFVDWEQRRPAQEILQNMREVTKDIAGVQLEFKKADDGPVQGKPFKLLVSGLDNKNIYATVAKIRNMMDDMGGFEAVEDNRPLPGIEWRLKVDRQEAGRYGANISVIGNAVQMVTNGIKAAEFRPDSSDDEVDIRIRFPREQRSLDQLLQLKINTVQGLVPLSNFVTLEPANKTSTVNRVDSRRVVTIQAEPAPGFLLNDLVVEMGEKLKAEQFPLDIRFKFKGEQEQQEETGAFLATAFAIAIFLMALILVTQFNSFYQTALVLSAIVFSTAGVLLGLLVTGQTFGIVMVGVGIIALAGIVVNNNIVLIDCYNDLRQKGHKPYDAALITGSLRLRPVLLTAVTTVLGLMPMVLAMNIDLIGRSISFGAPSTQWWTQLSSAIAGGLSFATLLTLFLTPCLLIIGDKLGGSRRYQSVAQNNSSQTFNDKKVDATVVTGIAK
ncbi:efflux RND transporter permease subunit [Psychrobium sp. MM17-31]|uniref:efflux RND transporter permease subunit n=1 Tax=Psychrobium sp. MM17-31 TaxID=2917758 RepID=UPI001EF62D8C|nr:efflux RND transporter permease subunit [Psychrobium sp. MM17-31]MCG7531077.1 efflux RND transporter permease subunit [Psychrobium sp. MM17-31]